MKKRFLVVFLFMFLLALPASAYVPTAPCGQEGFHTPEQIQSINNGFEVTLYIKGDDGIFTMDQRVFIPKGSRLQIFDDRFIQFDNSTSTGGKGSTCVLMSNGVYGHTGHQPILGSSAYFETSNGELNAFLSANPQYGTIYTDFIFAPIVESQSGLLKNIFILIPIIPLILLVVGGLGLRKCWAILVTELRGL